MYSKNIETKYGGAIQIYFNDVKEYKRLIELLNEVKQDMIKRNKTTSSIENLVSSLKIRYHAPEATSILFTNELLVLFEVIVDLITVIKRKESENLDKVMKCKNETLACQDGALKHQKEVIAFLAALSDAYKISNEETKKIIREILRSKNNYFKNLVASEMTTAELFTFMKNIKFD